MIAVSLIVRYLAGMIVGYLLGSIPFGLILAKRIAHVDVREYGSGAIGATNVSRTAGVKIGLLFRRAGFCQRVPRPCSFHD